MSKEFDFKDIGKKMPYKAPDNNFFENAYKNVANEGLRTIFITKIRRISWSAAVLVILLATALFVLNIDNNYNTQINTAEINIDSINSNFYIVNDNDNSINVVIQELSDQDLEYFIEGSEMDILYANIF